MANECEIIQHPQIEGLSVFLDSVDYRTPHFHAEWELLFILDQTLLVTVGQTPYRGVPGDVLIFNPNQPHEFRREEKTCTFLCVQISEARFAALCPGLAPFNLDGLFPRDALSPQQYRALQASLFALAEAYLGCAEGYPLYCIGQSCLLLHLLRTQLPGHTLTQEQTATQDKQNARLQRLLHFVDENYMDKIRLTDFAAEEGRSVHYLSAFVRKSLNMTFQDYVTLLRFHCACKLIAAGGHGMLEVCMLSGFSDYRYFSRVFKARVGMTPEQYSRLPQHRPPDAAKIHHSLHSHEAFYNPEESLALLRRYRAVAGL